MIPKWSQYIRDINAIKRKFVRFKFSSCKLRPKYNCIILYTRKRKEDTKKYIRRGNRSLQSLGKKDDENDLLQFIALFYSRGLRADFSSVNLTHSSDDYAPRFTRNPFYAHSNSATSTFVITSRRDSLPAVLSYKLPDRIYRAIFPSNFRANVTTIISSKTSK